MLRFKIFWKEGKQKLNMPILAPYYPMVLNILQPVFWLCMYMVPERSCLYSDFAIVLREDFSTVSTVCNTLVLNCDFGNYCGNSLHFSRTKRMFQVWQCQKLKKIYVVAFCSGKKKNMKQKKKLNGGKGYELFPMSDLENILYRNFWVWFSMC